MSSHEIVGIDVAARKLVAIGALAVLAGGYENTPAGRSRLIKAFVSQPASGAGRAGSHRHLFSRSRRRAGGGARLRPL